MAAVFPTPKLVAVQAGVTSTRGNAGIPNAGYKVAPVVMPVPQRRKAWLPRWHQGHPANGG